MSLQSLRAMRINRQRPTHCVYVVVGDRPKSMEDSEATVYVGPTAEPKLMDFRPMVGLNFVLFHIGSHHALAVNTLDAVVAAGGKCVAISLPDGDHSALNFPEVKQEKRFTYLVGKQRARLCQ